MVFSFKMLTKLSEKYFRCGLGAAFYIHILLFKLTGNPDTKFILRQNSRIWNTMNSVVTAINTVHIILLGYQTIRVVELRSEDRIFNGALLMLLILSGVTEVFLARNSKELVVSGNAIFFLYKDVGEL